MLGLIHKTIPVITYVTAVLCLDVREEEKKQKKTNKTKTALIFQRNLIECLNWRLLP